MAKIQRLSGFPEWLPEGQLIERHVLARVRERFELFGFTPLETRSVEPLDVLLAKGETDKEIYTLQRLHAAADREADFGLHYDLTVPLARYVAQNRGQLSFPYRRYQIQKVWRGERPQEGRFREFFQADVDVIGEGDLSVEYDAEMALVLHAVLEALPFPPVRIDVNNRKVLDGFYRALDIEDRVQALRIVDKLGKLGEAGVKRALVEELSLDAARADTILALGRIAGSGTEVVRAVRALGPRHDVLDEGLDELALVLDRTAHLPAGRVRANLRIARGFDYYTGTVYEGFVEGDAGLGAVCSGGRYDDLAAMGSKQKLPGVGVSIGVSRILGRLFAQDRLRASRATPSVVLVAVADDGRRADAAAVAAALRNRGVPCEVFDRAARYGKQIRYAEKRRIPYVWFTDAETEARVAGHAVRDIRTGRQTPADPGSWMPPQEDLPVRVWLETESPKPPNPAEPQNPTLFSY